MPQTRDPRDLIEAAEHAATSGDLPAAASLLRDAAALQDAQLGPWHPDLANTLNNLGVASESIGLTDEAESCYRRAVEIATAVLDPDDPLVATSRKNLRDFCEARGIPVDEATPHVAPLPADPPVPDDLRPAPDDLRLHASAEQAPLPEPAFEALTPAALELDRPAAPEADHRSPSRRLAVAVVFGVVLVVILMVTGRSWLTGRASDSPREATPATSDPSSPAPAPAPDATPPGPVTSGPVASEPVTPPRAAAAPEVRTNPAPPASDSRPAAAAGAAGGVAVSDARLCRSLGTGAGRYDCAPAVSPMAPGRLIFLTRVMAEHNTEVQHRWYRAGRLRQAITLPVVARPDGYHTYSRVTVLADPGTWRVAVTTRDGTVLGEESFEVR